MSSDNKLKNIVEAALLAAGKPLSLDVLLSLFLDEEQPDRKQLREVLAVLQEDYQGRGVEIVEVGSGWRIQVAKDYSSWISRLWEEKPGRYSRALLETLALIAYRQPITRGEIEEIRGVTVSTNIVKTMMERDWIHVVGQRDVPGRPSLYATTRDFLDYFGLKSLSDLPTLAEIKDLDELNQKLNLPDPDEDVKKADQANEAVLDFEAAEKARQEAEAAAEMQAEDVTSEESEEMLSELESETVADEVVPEPAEQQQVERTEDISETDEQEVSEADVRS